MAARPSSSAIVRRGRHEIGQPPPIGEQTIRFNADL